MLTLTVKKRGETRAPALRRAELIPAVVYGPHHASTPITVPIGSFEKIFVAAGEATVVSLEGIGEPFPTLIHDVDLDPLTNRPRHVDFYAVTRGEKVEVAVPLAFIGESPAVESGANLVKVMHELEIEADPMNLPHDIKVDLSVLKNVGDRIHVRDLILPAGVELRCELEEVVALVQEVVEEKAEEPAPADLSSIEVEKKGKEETTVEEVPAQREKE